MNIEYYSKAIIIIDNYDDETLIVANIDDLSKNKKQNYFFNGITVDDVVKMIKSVLNDDDYDIEYEINIFLHSKLCESIREQEEEE